MGTSFCWTWTTSTSGAAPCAAPDPPLERVAPMTTPSTTKRTPPAIQNLYFPKEFMSLPPVFLMDHLRRRRARSARSASVDTSGPVIRGVATLTQRLFDGYAAGHTARLPAKGELLA